MSKRFLAFILAFSLVLPMCPVRAYASEPQETTNAAEVTTETVTEAVTEAATEATTEAATEAIVQIDTDAATEATTEPATEPDEDDIQYSGSFSYSDDVLWTLTYGGVLTVYGSGEMDYSVYFTDPIVSVIVEDGVTSLHSRMFSHITGMQSLTIAGTVSYIPSEILKGYTTLTDLTIGDGNTAIGQSAFANCTNLTNVTIGNGNTTLYASAFAKCTNLKNVSIGDGNNTIGESAFTDCAGLTDVTIGRGNTTIGESAFANCAALSVMNLPDGVTEIAYCAFSNCDALTSVTIPDSVTSIGDESFVGCDALKEVTIGNGVTDMGEGVFAGCDGLVHVTLGDSVTMIKRRAFEECFSLAGVTIPDSVTAIEEYAFYKCTALADVTIGNGVTTIGNSAFYNCDSLTGVTIPDSVASIGESAFYNCDNLTDLTLGSGVTTIENSAFYNCDSLADVTIPDSVISIGESAFYNCDNLAYLTLGSGVTSIGNSAFYNCNSLTDVTIPDSVTSIGEYAFAYCEGLTDLDLGYGTETIGEHAFSDCSGLNSVTIPDSVATIGSCAFSGCSGLTSVTIPNSVSTIDTYAFASCDSLTYVALPDSITAISVGMFSGCESLTGVAIPGSVTSIGESAFYECKSLTSIPMGSGVTEIGSSAFRNCDGLTSVVIPDNVTTIGESAFYDCDNLTKVSTGNGVSRIDNSAFEYCAELRTLVLGSSVTTIGAWAFEGCDALVRLSLPDSVTSIGAAAFYGCDSLTSVTIGSGLASFAGSSFGACPNLIGLYVSDANPNYQHDQRGVLYDKSGTILVRAPDGIKGMYVIPAGVTTIGSSAFSGCSKLTDIVIGPDVTTIDYAAFQGSGLSKVKIPDYVTSLGESAFGACHSLTEVIIGNGITEIKDDTFKNCSKLISVTIGDSVTDIGEYAFYCCGSLTDVIFGNSVTDIGRYAFEQCTGLVSIYFPDSVTYIDYRAFYDCTSLTDAIFGRGIETLYAQSFGWCPELQTIIFRGSAPGVWTYYGDYYAFYGMKKACYLYYPADDASWANGWKHGYNATLTPYDKYTDIAASLGTRTDADALAIFPVVADFFLTDLAGKDAIMSGVTISSALGEATIPQTGYQIPLSDAAKQDIVLTKSGYRDYVLPAAVSKTMISMSFETAYSLTAHMQKDRKDGKPYISTVFGRTHGSSAPYVDLRVSQLNIKEGRSQDVIVTACGFGNQQVTYYLAQDGARRVSSQTGVFEDKLLYDVFNDTATVYAYAVGSDGTQTIPQEIKLKKVEYSDDLPAGLRVSEMSILGKDFLKMKISEDIPLLGGAEIDLAAFNFPIGVTTNGDEFKISLGLDLFASETEGNNYKWKSFKDLVFAQSKRLDEGADSLLEYDQNARAIDEFCRKNNLTSIARLDSSKKVNKFNLNTIGYIEGKFVNGELVVKEGLISLGGKFTFEYVAQGTVWVIPVYGAVEAGAGFSLSGKATRYLPDKAMPFDYDILLNIAPEVVGHAGVGIKNAVSGGLYAKGTLPVVIEFFKEHLSVGLNGELGVEGEFFLLQGKKVILSGSTSLIDYYYGSSVSGAAASKLQSAETETITTVMPRDYAEKTSAWLAHGNTAPKLYSSGSRAIAAEGVTFQDLQTSIFSNSHPQLVTLGNQMLLAWIEDDAARDTYNRMRLVYSVYDPESGSWSQPMPVWDDGHNDGYPQMVSDGTNVWLTWQKINVTLTEENTSDIDAAMESSEICLARYDAATGTFADQQMLTSNALYEYAHNVSLNDGVPTVYWASEEENILTNTGCHTLHRWNQGETTVLTQNLNYILSLDALGSGVTYVMDADGSGDTTNDITAFTLSGVNTTAFDNSETGIAVTYAGYIPMNGEETLFLSDMANIYYLQNGEVKTVLENSRAIGGNLNIVETPLGVTILWTEREEGWDELYAVRYENGEWTEPVMISDNDELISQVSAVCYDGLITGICNTNAVTYDETAGAYVKGTTDLSLFWVNDFTDIALSSSLSIQEAELESGENTQLYVTVKNNGTTTVSEITFTVSDTLDTESVQTVAVEIPSGGSEIVTLTYPVPSEYGAATLTVSAETNETDADTSDNAVSMEIGMRDLSIIETAVEQMDGGYLLKSTIENSSLVNAENVVLGVYMDESATELLQSVTIGTITRENYSLTDVLLKEDTLTFDENGNVKVYLKLTADGEEIAGADNQICVILTEAEDTVCLHPETETIEAKNATCSESGHNAYEVCIACGAIIGEFEEVPALSHTPGEAVAENVVEASCGFAGGYDSVVYCSVCDEELKREVVTIPAIAHSYGDWVAVKDASCTKPGEKHRICANCGYCEIGIISATGHSFVDHYCQVCGVNEYDTDSEGWPVYRALREQVLSAEETDRILAEGSETIEGVAFIDGYRKAAVIAEYQNESPENELYLSGGQSIAFRLSGLPTTLDDVQFAVKCVEGSSSVTVFNPGSTSSEVTAEDGSVTVTYAATKDNAQKIAVGNETDVYYSIENQAVTRTAASVEGKTIVICNSGTEPIAIANLKFAFTEPTVADGIVIEVDHAAAIAAQQSLALYSDTTVINAKLETEDKIEETTEAVEPETQATESAAEEPKPTLQETEPKVEEPKPAVKETEPEVEEPKPTVKETEPKVEEPKPTVKETEPKVEELKPTVKETEPKVEEPKPTVKETEPKVEEPKPTVKETEPKVEEPKPTVKETESKVEEIEPAAKETTPEVDEAELEETVSGMEVPAESSVWSNIRNAITNIFKTLFGWLLR